MNKKDKSFLKIKKHYINQKLNVGYVIKSFNRKELNKILRNFKDPKKIDLVKYSYCCEGPYKNCWIDYTNMWLKDSNKIKKIIKNKTKELFKGFERKDLLCYEDEWTKVYSWTEIDVSKKIHTRVDYSIILNK